MVGSSNSSFEAGFQLISNRRFGFKKIPELLTQDLNKTS